MASESIHNLRPTAGHHRQTSGGGSSSSKRPVLTASEEDVLPLSDQNAWYFPSHGHDSEEEEIPAYVGNWGRKDTGNARWVRGGKMAAWGPDMEDWEASFHFYLSEGRRNTDRLNVGRRTSSKARKNSPSSKTLAVPTDPSSPP